MTELLDRVLQLPAVADLKPDVRTRRVHYDWMETGKHRQRPSVGLPGIDCPDITLDADSFSRLQLAVQRVFITENEINFLAFPSVKDAIVIFGAGYGWDALARSHWLNDCTLHYWGDIDTHGFAILHQLRGHFAHVESFLMDRDTLLAHTAVWGTEDKPLLVDLSRLNPDERALYDDLRDNRIRKTLRLEQEQIGFAWMLRCLQNLLYAEGRAIELIDGYRSPTTNSVSSR